MYLITWILICNNWFHARHYMAILRQIKEDFGGIEKI